MGTRRIGWLAALVFVLAVSSGAGRTEEPVKLDRQGSRIDVAVGNAPFTTYYFDSAQAKPYLQPLRGARGTVVSRGFPIGDRIPQGHERDRSLEPHQRDLYFAHGNINGFNFWSEEAFGRF